jgi:hypothetical protein
VAIPKKGKGPARKKGKKAPSATGDEAVEPSARQFTWEEKGKSKGASRIIMIYIKPLIHILPVAVVDIEMANIHLNATGMPNANSNANPCTDVTMITACEEEADHSMDEQAQWAEDPVSKPSSSQISDIWEALTSLSSRISDIEAYLSLQGSTQPMPSTMGSLLGL